MDKPQKIEISHKTIVFTVFFLIALYFIFLVREIILLFFLAVIFMSAVNPLVSKLERYRLPRSVSISVVYLIVFALLVGAIAAIVPPFVSQLTSLISQINLPPGIIQDIRTLNINFQDLEVIANQLTSVPRILSVVFSAFGFVVVFFTISVMAFYLLLERRLLHKYLIWFFGNNRAESEAEDFLNKIEEQIGSWVRGQLTLMLIVGTLTYIGLKLLKITYALPLAILAGTLEILPNVGPTISAIPAIIVAYFTVSGPMAIAVTALYILVQQIENNFIVPMVMKRATGLNPIVTILLLLVGFKLGGAGGAILAIPIFLVTKIIALEIYRLKVPKGDSTKKEFGNE